MGCIAGWIVVALVAWPLLASAGAPEIDRDQRGVKKYAVENSGGSAWEAKARGLCVCLSEPANPEYENKLGFIFFQREVVTFPTEDRDMIAVRCLTFSYDRTTGERTAYLACDSWVPLAK